MSRGYCREILWHFVWIFIVNKKYRPKEILVKEKYNFVLKNCTYCFTKQLNFNAKILKNQVIPFQSKKKRTRNFNKNQWEILTFLLSSSTVFMFSIHNASMGPSKITHFRVSVWSDAYSRKVLAQIPSVHYKKIIKLLAKTSCRQELRYV